MYRFLLLLSLICTFVVGCSDEKNENNIITEVKMLNDKQYTIGVPEGTAAMLAVEKKYPNAKILYYGSVVDGYKSVETSKIDAFSFDRHAMDYAISTNPKLALLKESIGEEKIVVGISKKASYLKEDINKFIKQYREDGTYDDMYSRWFLNANFNLPEITPPTAPTKTLKVGIYSVNPPACFVGNNGELIGFDAEFIKRLECFLNVKFELFDMTFSAMIAGIETNKIDLIVANLNLTPERAEKMIFSDTYIDTDLAVLVKKERAPVDIKNKLDLDYYNGKRIAILAGSNFPSLINKRLKDIKYFEFLDNISGIEAVRVNKIDGLAIDEPVMHSIVRAYPDITFIPEFAAKDQYGVALPKGSPLREKLDVFIAESEKNGDLKEMKEYWLHSAEDVGFPEIDIPKNYDGSAGKLVVGCDPVMPGMLFYYKDNSIVGYEMDVMRRFAYSQNLTIETKVMPFGGLIAALQTGKIDLAVSSISITDERKKSIDFSIPYYKGGVVFLVKKPEQVVAFKYKDFDDFIKNSKAGAMTGSIGEIIVDKEYGNKDVSSFDSFSDGVPSVINKKIDFIIGSYTSLLIYANKLDALEVLPEKLTDDGNAIAFRKGNIDLRDKINNVLKKFREDGTLEDLEERWVNTGNYKKVNIAFNDNWPVLKVAIAADREPICFVQDGQYVGYDCELIERIAKELKMRVEYLNTKFSSMLPAMQSGKADLVISNLTKTKERAKMVEFSDVYFYNPQRLLVHKDTFNSLHPELAKAKEEIKVSFFVKLKDSFIRTFITENRYKLILSGLFVTTLISVVSIMLGTIFGFILCLMRRSSFAVLNLFSKIYIRIMQGTPIVVLLMILYYIVFGSIDINAILVAIIGFALTFAAYSSEMMRTGIESVDYGQLEAAHAMGFGHVKVFRKIVFPQAARYTLPVYKGEVIATVKSTAIVGYIAIQDLTKASDIIRSRTYEAFFPLIVTAIIYFLLTYAIIILISLVEWKIDPKRRKRIVKGVVTK